MEQRLTTRFAERAARPIPTAAQICGLLLSLALLAVGSSFPADSRSADRVVSANLCADQLLLALADAAQVLSLSPFARDPTLSFLAREALNFRVNRGNAEELIESKPDLVLIGSFDSRHARAMLERRGIAHVALTPWRKLDEGLVQIRDIAAILGQVERGEALVDRIFVSLARLESLARLRTRPASFLVIYRRGYVLHAGVLVELASLAGMTNLAAGTDLADSAVTPLERLVANPPDYLIVTQPPAAPADQGEAILAHPALLRLFPEQKRLVAPDRLAVCAGPSTPALIDALADEIARKVR